ncbi:hypothetical protein MRX96_057034 [Rhipicephalus microplus]
MQLDRGLWRGGTHLTVWPVWDQNVILCELNSAPTTERLPKAVILVVRSRQLSFYGHAKASGDVCNAVINIDHSNTSGFQKQELRWKHGNIL